MMDHLPWKRRILVSHLPTQVLNIEEYLKKDIKVVTALWTDIKTILPSSENIY